VIRVVRDLFNEDFREVVIQGTDAYEQVEQYLGHVSPDLVARIRRHTGSGDVFAEWRIDEQILKGLDRKVYLPSGGHLVIDRTEAMTVVDVNTGKYTGAGGNLEETVTRNNLEAAEEIVRQLRLRDLGGIVVIDFIDMVLESNRDLGAASPDRVPGPRPDQAPGHRDHLARPGADDPQADRQGLLEAFSETCEHCKGRGVMIQTGAGAGALPQRCGREGPGDGRVEALRRRGGRRRRRGPTRSGPRGRPRGRLLHQ
jgi:ribonuclease E